MTKTNPTSNPLVLWLNGGLQSLDPKALKIVGSETYDREVQTYSLSSSFNLPYRQIDFSSIKNRFPSSVKASKPGKSYVTSAKGSLTSGKLNVMLIDIPVQPQTEVDLK
ncbi:hypothetical protein HKD37_11G031761 [Glycine soja]